MYKYLIQFIFLISDIFQAIPFWTGGKVLALDTVNPDAGEAGSPQYKFESSGKMLSDLSEWPSLAWDNGKLITSSTQFHERNAIFLMESLYRFFHRGAIRRFRSRPGTMHKRNPL